MYLLPDQSKNKKVCSFCGSELGKKRPQIKKTIKLDEAYQSQPTLAKYHIYDLFLFLRQIRAKRTDMYNKVVMQIARKASEEAKKTLKTMKKLKLIVLIYIVNLQLVYSYDNLLLYCNRIATKIEKTNKSK